MMRIPESPKPVDVGSIDGLTLLDSMDDLDRTGGATVKGRYVHWDKLRRLTPPEGLASEDWWTVIKLSRHVQYRTLPLRDMSGKPFVYMLPDSVQQALHEIDSRAHGRVGTPAGAGKGDVADERFIIGALIDEAISSSQLEGAATTRVVAREMIRQGRQPRDVDERMIVNNYRAITRIREIKDGPLTEDTLLELHSALTAGTLDDPDAEGRLQTEEDDRVKVVDRDGEVVHIPPPARDLRARLASMLEFANGGDQPFVHPVIRAIALHFWLAYEHPFKDGNGRTARALFYWCMLHRGYRMFAFISISQLLLKAPVRYGRAFLETETDGNDLTYFIVHQIEVIQRSLDALESYVQKKLSEITRLEAKLKRASGLNHRQLALLAHAIRHPDAEYTVQSHRTSHGVAYATARSDLLDLADGCFLERGMVGRRKSVFFPATDLQGRIDGAAGSA